ncbi:hypothetical protein CYMTET_50678 [Cymbomonas tetramitiformis]|uniref:Fe2OG dioxygenase domain-containing protein n=1 Tax=Cymbomonas tetramitiformis TaxID=36881 RepID=A0AAE0BMQ6_9CHLO|nr:hypothetical protein CYMTET_50678 [Cymbomonas tetramitiformis]
MSTSVKDTIMVSAAGKKLGAGLTTGEPNVLERYSKKCRHPELFDVSKGWKRQWFEPAFFEAIQSSHHGDNAKLQSLLEEESPGVYSFPMMTTEFCLMFIEELDNYKSSGLPIRRPNSMNNYGIVVNDIGMERMLSYLQRDFLHPVGLTLFPKEGSQFDAHHSFMVQYKEGEDLGLDMHTDDSDVTFNLCLGKEFTASGLTFCGMMGDPTHRQFTFAYQHRVGRCVVHLGRKRHGADDIQCKTGLLGSLSGGRKKLGRSWEEFASICYEKLSEEVVFFSIKRRWGEVVSLSFDKHLEDELCIRLKKHLEGVVSFNCHKLLEDVVPASFEKAPGRIQSGERNNLIIWNHNHAFRATGAHRTTMSEYSKEAGPPDLQCLSYTHDRDYTAYKDLPGQAGGSRPWCPPPAGCYDQMDDVLSGKNNGKSN